MKFNDIGSINNIKEVMHKNCASDTCWEDIRTNYFYGNKYINLKTNV